MGSIPARDVLSKAEYIRKISNMISAFFLVGMDGAETVTGHDSKYTYITVQEDYGASGDIEPIIHLLCKVWMVCGGLRILRI